MNRDSKNVLAEIGQKKVAPVGETFVNNCTMCEFHDLQPLAMPDGKPIIGKSQMICRRFPPTVVAMQLPTSQGFSVQLMPMFPPVGDSVWCFEYSPENGHKTSDNA